MHKMTQTPARSKKSTQRAAAYNLDTQIGFLLRKAHQRHRGIFSKEIGLKLAPTQFATLASLYIDGETSQNQLGRRTAMDTATITGVVDRLAQRGLLAARPSPVDERLSIVSLTDEGRTLVESLLPRAESISEATLSPLSAAERATLLDLLTRIAGG